MKSVESSIKAGAQKSANSGKTPEMVAAEKMRKMKAEKDAMEKELARLMKSTLCIKHEPVPEGVDPKSILCAFFKAGVCEKGARCKFGHDLTLARKAPKASLYEAKEPKKEEDLMADWDQEKLEQVVKNKQGKTVMQTDIVCQ